MQQRHNIDVVQGGWRSMQIGMLRHREISATGFNQLRGQVRLNLFLPQQQLREVLVAVHSVSC